MSDDAISVDNSHEVDIEEMCDGIGQNETGEMLRLKHLANWPPVNILFQDVTQTVPDVTCGKCEPVNNGTDNRGVFI